jgi:crotonobetainyl-CoA:carnitine CoA-transferase CaiB-like acyl-CoA transferase
MYFTAHNRYKQSLAIDLKRPEASPILERLLGWADVLVTNYTPSAVERLGLDYISASRINSRLVVVRISAYGKSGSGREVPGFDGTVQARSGLAHMVGSPDGPPTITSLPLTDYLVAVEGALGALLGLQLRTVTGQGQEVDVSMLDATSTVLGYLYAEVLAYGQQPIRSGNRAPYALTGAYPASDGYVYVAPLGDQAWRSLCGLIGRSEWALPGARYADPDTRLRERDIVEAGVGEWTRTLPRSELIVRLADAGIPCGELKTVAEVAVDPLLRERCMLRQVELGTSGTMVPMPGVEIKLDGAAGDDRHASAPALGAHSRQVLRQLGFGDDEVERLKRTGVIVC